MSRKRKSSRPPSSLKNTRDFWVILRKLKHRCSKTETLRQLLEEMTEGMLLLSGGVDCRWYQVPGFSKRPCLEPNDLAVLFESKGSGYLELIDICLSIEASHAERSFEKQGVVVEFSYYPEEGRECCLIRIWDSHFGMDNWVVLDAPRSGCFFSNPVLLDSFLEWLLAVGLRHAKWFNANRRIAAQFDRLFETTDGCLTMGKDFSLHLSACRRMLRELCMDHTDFLTLVESVKGSLSEWQNRENLYQSRQTRIHSFTIRTGHHDWVVLVKYDATNHHWKILFNVDSVQRVRDDLARRLFTKRQFAAFLHFENGNVSAESLSACMGISPRTAERYRSIIIHHLENDLKPYFRV